MRETVTYLYAKRLEAFGKLMSGESRGEAQIRLWVVNCWNYVKHPWFIAFLELRAAARTEKQLADALFPAEQEFEAALCQLTVHCAAGRCDAEVFYAALDISRYAMEGMAIHLLARDETAREQQLLRYLENRLQDFQLHSAAQA